MKNDIPERTKDFALRAVGLCQTRDAKSMVIQNRGSAANESPDRLRASVVGPLAERSIFLVQRVFLVVLQANTRAVPLVRKEDAHQGRVSFLPSRKGLGQGGGLQRRLTAAYQNLIREQATACPIPLE